MTRQIYVNLLVKNLERSKAFFTALGFSFEPKFTYFIRSLIPQQATGMRSLFNSCTAMLSRTSTAISGNSFT